MYCQVLIQDYSADAINCHKQLAKRQLKPKLARKGGENIIYFSSLTGSVVCWCITVYYLWRQRYFKLDGQTIVTKEVNNEKKSKYTGLFPQAITWFRHCIVVIP